MPNVVKKFECTAGFLGVADLHRFTSIRFKNDNKNIALEFDGGANEVYTVTLNQGASPNYYAGGFALNSGGATIRQGTASGRLFDTDDGYLFFGHWREENIDYKWFVEITEQ